MPKYAHAHSCDKFSDNLSAISQWQWSTYTWIWMQLSYDVYIYVVSNFCLSLYLHVAGVWESPGKTFLGVLESHGKVLEIFLNERVGTLCERLSTFSRTTVSCWPTNHTPWTRSIWRSLRIKIARRNKLSLIGTLQPVWVSQPTGWLLNCTEYFLLCDCMQCKLQRMVLLLQFCLSICLSDACIVTKLNDALRIFDTTQSCNHRTQCLKKTTLM